MATLPQAADYGSRIPLRSNRVDLPGPGEAAVADAVSRAAAAFTQMAIEHKDADDALSYANAKNEYLIADIKEREKLKDDADFDTHDERYRTAMSGHYDRLVGTIASPRDRHLFDAEARLMNERGAVGVNENARVRSIDRDIERFNSHAQQARDIMLATNDPQVAQDAMFGVLQEATALRDRGYLDADEYTAALQTWVQESAIARLVAMTPEERVEALQRSVDARRATGQPITDEDIKAGNGTGSIADFLHLDTAVRMLEQAEKANEIETTLNDAQGIFDLARDRFPEGGAAMNDYIRELADGFEDPRVRTQAVALGRQYRDERRDELVDKRDRIMTGGSEMIRNGMSPGDIDPDDLATLTGTQVATLWDEWQQHQEGSRFGKRTVWTLTQQEEQDAGASYALWRSIPDEQKPVVNLDAAEWRMSLTPEVHKSLVDEQQALIAAQESGQPLRPGLTNVQMVTSALVRSGFIPQFGRETEDSESYQRLLFEFDRATQAAQSQQGAPLSNEQRNQILGELMVPMAFTDDYVWWPDKKPGEMVPIAAMSSEQLKTARLPWAQAANDIASTSSAGITATYRQELELMARRLQVEPDTDDYERAYFALKYQLGADEVVARLRGEGSGTGYGSLVGRRLDDITRLRREREARLAR